MKYINNWAARLMAPLGPSDTLLQIPPEEAARLDLSNGVYWLTLTDSPNPLEQTKWEIVEVSEGLVVERGMDGTTAQQWPADTLIYCAVTAGQLSALQARVQALENNTGGGGTVSGALTGVSGAILTDHEGNTLTGSEI